MQKTEKQKEPRADILIVDDTLANLKLLSELLKRQGYKARGVSSGEMAITASGAAPPDLVLLDIKMPEMDGYEVCKRLKDKTVTCDIPVIFISALEDALDKVKAFSVGGIDYISKPFQEEEVLARVENHLKISRLQRELEQRNSELAESMQALKDKHAEILQLQRREVLAGERERIMRDMHDGIGGQLISTLALLDVENPDIIEISEALKTALDDLRLMIDSLDPLEGDDLAMLLGMYRARILPRLQAAGLEVAWQLSDIPHITGLGPHKVLQLLRILQEAVTNVLKHSQATKLAMLTGELESNGSGRKLYIDIEDNGKGLPAPIPEGRGLKNMKKRADSIGAKLMLGLIKEGTRVRIILPAQV